MRVNIDKVLDVLNVWGLVALALSRRLRRSRVAARTGSSRVGGVPSKPADRVTRWQLKRLRRIERRLAWQRLVRELKSFWR